MRKATMVNGMVLVNDNFMVGRDGSALKLYKQNRNGHKAGEWSEPTITTTNDGYKLVCVDGKKQELLHRLVWTSFNGEIPDGLEINHIDEDKSNNSLDNLELVTREQNMNHGTCLQRCTETKKMNGVYKRIAESKSKPVVGINIKTGEKIEFPSGREAGRNGFIQGSICACAKGKLKSHKGYKWYYKSDYESNE